MVLDVRRALQAGYDDLTSTAGLNVLAVLLVYNLGYDVLLASFRQGLLESIREPGPVSIGFVVPPFGWDALLLDLPLPVLAGLAVGVVLTAEAVRFWAIRLFADLSVASVPEARERLAVLLTVAGGFALLLFGFRWVVPVFWLSQGLGTVTLVSQAAGVVALLLVGVTVYLRQEIALTDADARGTVRHSVRRFLAEPVPILGLLALLGFLGALSVLPAMLAAYVDVLDSGGWVPLVPIAELVGLVLGTVLSTFSIATITDAYLQVRGGAVGVGPA